MPEMNFGQERRQENNSISRNASRSDVLTLLTLLNADAKSGVLISTSSLTKGEVCSLSLPHFPRWICLISLRYSTMVGFVLSTTFSVTEVPLLEEIQLGLIATSQDVSFEHTF